MNNNIVHKFTKLQNVITQNYFSVLFDLKKNNNKKQKNTKTHVNNFFLSLHTFQV